VEISVTGTDLARPEVKKKNRLRKCIRNFVFSSSLSLFSSQTLYWKALKPHDLFRFNTQRIQVLWNHIAVLIALLTHRTLTQLKNRRTFLLEKSSHLPTVLVLAHSDGFPR